MDQAERQPGPVQQHLWQQVTYQKKVAFTVRASWHPSWLFRLAYPGAFVLLLCQEMKYWTPTLGSCSGPRVRALAPDATAGSHYPTWEDFRSLVPQGRVIKKSAMKQSWAQRLTLQHIWTLPYVLIVLVSTRRNRPVLNVLWICEFKIYHHRRHFRRPPWTENPFWFQLPDFYHSNTLFSLFCQSNIYHDYIGILGGARVEITSRSSRLYNTVGCTSGQR